MSSDTTDQGRTGSESNAAEEQDWGETIVAVLVSVVAALVAHYVLFAGLSLHPTLHALIGVVLFFIAGFVMFQIVLS